MAPNFWFLPLHILLECTVGQGISSKLRVPLQHVPGIHHFLPPLLLCCYASPLSVWGAITHPSEGLLAQILGNPTLC